MAADYDVRLLSKAVRDRNLLPLLEAGVNVDWFFEEEQQTIWRFVNEHYSRYSECPTVVTVKDNFPGCKILKVEDSLDYLLDVAIEARRKVKVRETVQKAAFAIEDDDDYDAALNTLRSGLVEIDSENGRENLDINVADEAVIDEMLARYEWLEEHHDEIAGIPTGFPTIDRATGGLQAQQLITLIATPKTGKSTAALKMADNIRSNESLSEVAVLVVSFEMSNAEQKDRLNAMRSSVSASRLRSGRLKPDEKKRLQRALPASRHMNDLWLTEDIAGATVSGIAAKIEKLKPKVIFLDGVYLMTDEVTGEQNTPQALTNITRNLKRLAKRTDTCIVILTQVLAWKMQKKKVTADAIGYSSSFFQDSDVIIGLERVTGVDGEEDEMSRILKVVESRNCGKVSANVLWDWETSRFEETGEYKLDDEDEDDDDD